MNNGKYQKQLKWVFISLGMLFALLFIISISFFIQTSFKNQYCDSLKQSVNSSNTLAEMTFTIIHSARTDLLSDPDIKLWSSASDQSQYFYYAYMVKKKLNLLLTRYPTIPLYAAVTHITSDSMVISPLGSSQKEEFFREETTLSPDQVDMVYTYFTEGKGEILVPTYKNGQINELYYFTVAPYSRKDTLYIIKVPQYSLVISDLTSNFIIYDEASVIAYKENSETAREYWNSIYPTLQKDASVKDYNMIEDRKAFIFSSGFSHIPWKIAYSYDTMKLSYLQVILYIFLPFVLLSSLMLFLFRKLSTWLYTPVKEIVSQLIEENKDFPKDRKVFDEFHLLRQSTASVKTLTAELQQAMNENNLLISQRFYRDLLLGLDTGSFPLDDESYCVALFEFQESEDPLIEQDIFFCKNTILTTIGENAKLQYVNISLSDCAVIIQCEKPEEAKEMILSISNVLPEEQNIKIAVSRIRTSMKQIHQGFLESQKILEYKYLYSHEEILTADTVLNSGKTGYHYPLLVENRLIQQIAKGNEQALDSFDLLIRENFMQRNLTPEALRNFIYMLLATINRIFQELKTTPEELLQHPIDFAQLYADWSQPNIISIIHLIIEEIISSIQCQNNNSDSRILKQMQEFIFNNYSRDIMLDDMAEALGISGKYCSNLFKKLSDDTFKNFLNSYRVEQAKHLLEQDSSIKISDLSLMVGFNSSNTLIRVFRKYTGLTPKEYEEMAKKP